MSQITLKTGIVGDDGQEEILTEYLCDWPDCPNPAEHALGFARELGTCSAVCTDHFAMLEARHKRDQRR
jgi:hypothetical protein